MREREKEIERGKRERGKRERGGRERERGREREARRGCCEEMITEHNARISPL